MWPEDGISKLCSWTNWTQPLHIYISFVSSVVQIYYVLILCFHIINQTVINKANYLLRTFWAGIEWFILRSGLRLLFWYSVKVWCHPYYFPLGFNQAIFHFILYFFKGQDHYFSRLSYHTSNVFLWPLPAFAPFFYWIFFLTYNILLICCRRFSDPTLLLSSSCPLLLFQGTCCRLEEICSPSREAGSLFIQCLTGHIFVCCWMW